MNPNDINVLMLESVARRLGDDLLRELAVTDGRDSLIEECRASRAELRAYLRERVAELLATPAFIDALPGHLPGDAGSQARLPDLEGKLRALARLE